MDKPMNLLFRFPESESEVMVGWSWQHNEGRLTMWDVATGCLIAHYFGPDLCSPLNSVVVIPTSYSLVASASTSINFWKWHHPYIYCQIPTSEEIGPLACTSDGAYLFGGAVSGNMHVWELGSGQLVRSWCAHKKMVGSLALSDDESLIISGGDDGIVNVWPLVHILDIAGMTTQVVFPLHCLSAHSLPVTGLACGVGGCSALLVSSSTDCTVKVWSLGLGVHLRTFKTPSAVQTIVLDPTEHVLYAGCRDGRIFIIALKHANRKSRYELDKADGILGLLSNHSGAITSLSFCADGVTLVSASHDCTITMWDTLSNCIIRILQPNMGPLNSVLIFSLPGQALCPFSDGLQYCNMVPAKGYDHYKTTDLKNFIHSNDICRPLTSKFGIDTWVDANSFSNSMQIIDHRVHECELMKANLAVVSQDHQRSLDMLDKMIHVHRKVLQFCISQAQTD